ncbi:MAG: mechanosensitive ion channel family protein [Planctomycetes bacterium]|nr:mechanosensitive ion channel family protein [Planctomycetota bacterium]
MTTNRWMRRLAGLLLAAVGLAGSALAQAPEDAAEAAPPVRVPSDFDSPLSTLRTFIVAMGAGDRGRATECMDLSQVEPEGAQDRAQELYRCINRLEFIDFEGDESLLAAGPDRIGDETLWSYFPRELPSGARVYGSQRYRLLARQERFDQVRRIAPDAAIELTRGPGGRWSFSAATVKNARAFWEQLQAAKVQPVAELAGKETLTIAERFESLWPDVFVSSRFLTVKAWQWITLLAIIIVGVLLDFTIRLFLTLIWRRAILRRGGKAKKETLRKTVRPFGLAAAAVLWLWAIRLLGLPDEALKILVPAVKFFAMLAVVWSAFRVTDLLAEVAASKAERTNTRFDDVLIPLLRKAIKVFIFVFGMIYIASAMNVGIAPLITGLGIGGAGFAFAAKDTLEHLFGSVTVIADRPFEAGDWVQIGDVEGTVEELGFRSTRIRTFYNSLVSVPNGNLVRAVVDNYGRRKYRRWSTHLNVTYDTPPARIEAFCEGIREIIRLHPYTRKDYYQVWLHKFGAHSLDILLYVFFEAPDWNTELRERHRFMLDVLRLADRLGVEFAFPTQTLHAYREEKGVAHTPGEAPTTDTDRRAHAEGRRAVRAITSAAEWRGGMPPPMTIPTTSQAGDDEETQIESKVAGSAGGE